MNERLPPILIIGGGLAGVFCALKLAPLPVAIIAPAPVGDSGASRWAQGGIAAAVEEGDTPESHARDTVAAGAGLVDYDIALGMAGEARIRVEELAEMGAPFDRTSQGLFAPSREAAHSRHRVVRVKGDSAGRAIMETLRQQVGRIGTIEHLEGYAAQEIVTRNGRVVGVHVRETGGASRYLPCAALVLATGGLGHLYRITTNPLDARGVGVAMAARAGAVIADAEFVQFHPTAIDIDVDPAPLATEALRGEGATIIDRDGHRFLSDINPAGELAPRDIVARAVFASIRAGRGAFLDARSSIGATFPDRFPTVYASCRAAGLDPVVAPIPIAPAAHYHMGGVWTDARGRTSLEGLWAIGEVAATGVHGANRLASNSLLEAVVFAARAASDIRMMDLSVVDAPAPAHLASTGLVDSDMGVVEELRDLMSANVGVIRDAAGLAGALGELRRLRARVGDVEIVNMVTTSMLIAAAAYVRRESRGAHYRADYPAPDATQAQRSRMTLDVALRIADEAHP